MDVLLYTYLFNQGLDRAKEMGLEDEFIEELLEGLCELDDLDNEIARALDVLEHGEET